MDIPVGWQDVAHDHKVNLLSMRKLDTVETKEAAQKSVGVLFDVLMWQWIAKMNVSLGTVGDRVRHWALCFRLCWALTLKYSLRIFRMNLCSVWEMVLIMNR